VYEEYDEGYVVYGDVSQLNGEGNVVYRDLFMRCRVRDILVQGCMSEVDGEGIIVYRDVCMRYRMKKSFLQ